MVKKAGQNIGHTEWWSGGVAMLNGEQDKAKREGGAPRRPDIGDPPGERLWRCAFLCTLGDIIGFKARMSTGKSNKC
jgi:hypothetical protein